MTRQNRKEKDVRLPLEGGRLIAWEKMLKAKRIGQQDALLALIDCVVVQDDTVQSMMLGQLVPREDLIAVVLKRLSDASDPPATFTDVVDENQDISEATRQRIGKLAQAKADAAAEPINGRIAVIEPVGSNPTSKRSQKAQK